MMTLSYTDLLNRHPADIPGIIIPFVNSLEQRADFPWEMFADACDGKARELLLSNPSCALQWAAVAVIIFDRLSRVESGSALQNIERHAMALRATFITKLGPKVADPVLDPHIVEEWFFTRLDLSIRDFQSVRNVVDDPFVVIQVDYLCQRCKVLLPLFEAGYCTRNAELSQWKSVIEKSND